MECRLHSQTTLAPCPDCKQEQTAVHSHYQRKVADLPWSDFSVKLLIVVRRFFCRNGSCSRKTFAERPPFLVPYARRTSRLNQNLSKLAFATNAQTGSKLSTVLAMPVSSSTMLRLMHRQPTEPASAPAVLGVDDFATCKGKSYGTILVDIEKQQVIDLLPGREAQPLTTWLQSRPSICFITRDRAPAYSEAAASGAPQAVQIADRFHLLVNLTDALQRFFDGQADCLRQTGSALSQQSQPSQQVQPLDQPAPGAAPMQPGSQSVAPAAEKAPTAKQLVFNQVKELQAKGHSSRSIARLLSVSRTRVTRYMTHQQLPAYSPRVGGTKFSPFLAVIEQNWSQGKCNRWQLYELLQQQGYTGSYGNLCKFLHRYPGPQSIGTSPGLVAVSARKAALLLSRLPEDLSSGQQEELSAILTHCPAAAGIHCLVTDFAAMVRKRESGLLDEWLQKAADCPVAPLRSLAKGIKRDYDAVKAALSYSYSNGPVEGQVNRLKLVKRQTYGRAGFDLLRKRVLFKL